MKARGGGGRGAASSAVRSCRVRLAGDMALWRQDLGESAKRIFQSMIFVGILSGISLFYS
jgi:hypothetical protein